MVRPAVELGSSQEQTNPKHIYRSELKPAMRREAESAEFGRIIRLYEVALNTSVWDPDLQEGDKDIVDSAQIVAQARIAQRELRKKGINPTSDEVLTDNTTKVFNWFAKKFPNTETVLSSLVSGDKQKEAELQLLIGRNLSRWINIRNSSGTGFRRQIEAQALQEMGSFLLTNAPAFHDLSRVTPLGGSVLDDVDYARLSALVNTSVLEGRDDIAAFATRDWIATTAQAARRGLKIYETPYYKEIIDDILFRENKQNGVGGVILYGPPGTGKTEILTEANRRLGFKTRVINIHHYTSFEDLIGGKVIQLGLERGASVTQHVKTVLEVFDKESPDQFREYVTSLFVQLQKEGKLGSYETLEDFLSSFVSDDTRERLSKEQLTTEDWGIIKDDFIKTQKGRILRTVLPSTYQEAVEDIVRGEIMLAIKNNQRVTLDELDKAGPNSLGGILSFLAQSPGEYFEYGQVREKIPVWFRVNATSNSTELNKYLTNRFGQREVTTPPPKDQLMIAAVRLADHQGNILLNDYEQRQIVGFYSVLVPEINAVLTQTIQGKPAAAPLSNRDIQQLTSYLIDFAAMRRTHLTVGEAIRRFLAERTLTTPDLLQPINRIIDDFSRILKDKPIDFRQGPYDDSTTDLSSLENYLKSRGKTWEQVTEELRTQVERSVNPELVEDELNRRLATFQSRASSLEEGLKQVQTSPIIRAINGLGDEMETSHPVVKEVNLTQQQRKRANTLLEAKKKLESSKRPDMISLPTGLVLEKKYGDDRDRPYINLFGASEADDETHVIESDILPFDGRMVCASADGRVIVIATPTTDQKQENVSVINAFRNKATEASSRYNFNKDCDIKTDSRAQRVFVLDKSTHNLYSMAEGKTNQIDQNVSKFEVSPDGRVVLIGFDSGDSTILSTTTKTPLAFLKGTSWKFISDNLLVAETDSLVGEKGYALT